MPDAEIGVFGGSGFSELLPGAAEVVVETPYGPPSAPITVGEVGGRRVAFLPRHGRRHEIPPHMINYRANIAAMEQLGVRRILGPCAAGSLQPRVRPGDFVVCDQYPECALAREREICYVNISLITDYDVGVEGDPTVTSVTAAEVVRTFRENLNRLRDLIFRVIPAIPRERTCICATALQQARV